MRILGIDPGLTRCGIGIIDVSARRVPSFVHVETVRSDRELAIEQRLLYILNRVRALLDEFAPQRVALELVFAQHNVASVIAVAQLQGAIMTEIAGRGIPLGGYTPNEVKAAVTGYGASEKAQVGAMVARHLRLQAVPKPADAADALAIALCDAWRTPVARMRAERNRTVNTTPDQTLSGATLTPAQRAWLAAARQAKSRGRR